MIHERINLGLTALALDKMDLASKLWPESTPQAQYQNILLLLKGKTKKLTQDQVIIICEFLKVDANYLFS